MSTETSIYSQDGSHPAYGRLSGGYHLVRATRAAAMSLLTKSSDSTSASSIAAACSHCGQFGVTTKSSTTPTLSELGAGRHGKVPLARIPMGRCREDRDQGKFFGPRSHTGSRTMRNKPAALERLRRDRRASATRPLRSKGSEVPACSCTKESRCRE